MIIPIYSSFQSWDGSYPIIATTWHPEGKVKGVIQIVHGMQEHIGRYERFARYFNQQGYIVTGHDHLGHGKTAQNYGAYGYFGKEKGAKRLVNDSAKYTKMLSESYKGTPLFVLGHSMGSFISRMQVLKVSHLISGYLCLGTSGGGFYMSLARVLAQLISSTKGGKNYTNLMSKSMNLVMSRDLEQGEPWDNWISHDKKAVADYIDDPFTRFNFTNQGYCDLIDLEIACNIDEWYKRMNANLPVVLLSGADDPLSNMGKHLPIIHRKLKSKGKLTDVSYNVYPNMRHEILNEIEYMTVYHDISNWINNRV